MVTIRFEKEVPAAVVSSKMFKAYILDSHNLPPNLAPQASTSVEFLEGDGAVDLSVDLEQSKQRIEELDTQCSREMGFGNVRENSIRLEPSGNGGCIFKFVTECHIKIDHQEVNEEFITDNEEKGMELYKVVEAHLLANPHLYA